LIWSFSKLDYEILGRVIEEHEEATNIERLLREKLLIKLKNSVEDNEDVEAALLQLFDEIQCLDGAHDGFISHNELRVLLRRLNIHFTLRRFDDAFSLFDKDADGRINLLEFHAFIFPTEASETNRKKRLKRAADAGLLPYGIDGNAEIITTDESNVRNKRRGKFSIGRKSAVQKKRIAEEDQDDIELPDRISFSSARKSILSLIRRPTLRSTFQMGRRGGIQKKTLGSPMKKGSESRLKSGTILPSDSSLDINNNNNNGIMTDNDRLDIPITKSDSDNKKIQVNEINSSNNVMSESSRADMITPFSDLY
jgi:hypothetical protein